MDLSKLVPDKLQSTKELTRQGANVFFFLFVVQAFGLDLSKFGLSPVIDWKMSFALYVLFMGPLTYISNHQEIENKKNGTGTGSTTIPPAPPSDPPKP